MSSVDQINLLFFKIKDQLNKGCESEKKQISRRVLWIKSSGLINEKNELPWHRWSQFQKNPWHRGEGTGNPWKNWVAEETQQNKPVENTGERNEMKMN